MPEETHREVFFYNPDGRLHRVPLSFTSLAQPDPFVEVSAGRAHLRPQDLLQLVKMLERLNDTGL
jgi:Family of unknown function (DUF5372)